jgi:hypothetical protein
VGTDFEEAASTAWEEFRDSTLGRASNRGGWMLGRGSAAIAGATAGNLTLHEA